MKKLFFLVLFVSLFYGCVANLQQNSPQTLLNKLVGMMSYDDVRNPAESGR